MSRIKYHKWMLLPAAVGLSVSALVLSQNFSGNEALAKPAGKANVIVIMADDLGYADVSLYKGGRVSTPNLEKLARDGVLFTQGYVAAPICSPSRAGLMTGRHPTRFGHEYNFGEGHIFDADNKEVKEPGLAVGEITLAQAMKSAGYRTGLIGKWHLGSHDQFYPTSRGFDEFFGFMAAATTYIDPKNPQVVSLNKNSAGKRDEGAQIMEGKDRKIINNLDKYATEDFADHAVDFIKRHKSEPFFLYTAFNAPHSPLQVTKKYYDRFPNVKEEKLRIYFAMISALDDAVGKILQTLDDEGLAENTLVVFLSDNGCSGYVGGICACEPLRGAKATHYEGGTRVPYVMRWPAQLPQGKVYEQRVSSLDIFPTALAAAGGTLADDRVYDGVDLRPYVNGENKSTPHAELQWLRRPQASMIAGDWRLWESDDGKVKKLFDLANDPNETNNLYSARPDKVKEMAAKMSAFRAGMAKPSWIVDIGRTVNMCGEELEMPR